MSRACKSRVCVAIAAIRKTEREIKRPKVKEKGKESMCGRERGHRGILGVGGYTVGAEKGRAAEARGRQPLFEYYCGAGATGG